MAWNPTYRSRTRRAKSCGGAERIGDPPGLQGETDTRAACAQRVEKRLGFLLVHHARSAPAEHRRETPRTGCATSTVFTPVSARRLGARQQASVPVLADRIPLPHEQDLAPRRVAGHQHENRVRLVKPCQVVEVAVLPVLVVDIERVVARRRAQQDGHRLGPERSIIRARRADRSSLSSLPNATDACNRRPRAATACGFIEPECTPVKRRLDR